MRVWPGFTQDRFLYARQSPENYGRREGIEGEILDQSLSLNFLNNEQECDAMAVAASFPWPIVRKFQLQSGGAAAADFMLSRPPLRLVPPTLTLTLEIHTRRQRAPSTTYSSMSGPIPRGNRAQSMCDAVRGIGTAR